MKWNRGAVRKPDSKKDEPEEFKVMRVRPKRKKPPRPGYTLVPKHRQWIFEK